MNVLVRVALLFGFLGPLHFSITLPSIEQTPYRLPPSAVRQDLRQLVQTLENVHPNLYFKVDSIRFAARVDSLAQTMSDSLTPLDFWREVSPLVASIGDGHTFLGFPWKRWKDYLNQGGYLFPLSLRIQEGRGYLRKVDPQYPDLPVNAEILAINGVQFTTIVTSLVQRISGERISFREDIASRNLAAFLWALYPQWSSDYTLEFRVSTTDTIREVIYIAGTTRLSDTKIQSTQVPYSFREIPNLPVGVIDFRSMRDLPAFKGFLQKTFQTIKDDSLKALIIDIRKNGGGNSRLGDALIAYLTDQPYRQVVEMDVKTSGEAKRFLIRRFIKWWQYPLLPLAIFHPQGRALLLKKNGTITTFTLEPHPPERVKNRFQGKVYLLTSRHTFSSANMLAITFKCYNLGTIIGEETGGVTIAYGDIISFTLPHTKLIGGVSYKRFVHPCGKEDGHGVIPDIPVTAEIESRRDQVMEVALDLIRKELTDGRL